jgi:uncharacterized membrane protein YqjE
MDESEHSSGVLASLRRMAETALRTVQNRIELFAAELQAEKSWLIATLLWAAAAVFFCGLAIIFVVGTVIYFAPEGARPWVLGGFCVLFVYLAVNAVVGLHRSVRDKPAPMADTIGELKKDLDWIRPRD